jgi:hypothetical protein
MNYVKLPYEALPKATTWPVAQEALEYLKRHARG